VAIELSHAGEEKVQDGTLEEELRSALGVSADFPVFVPAASYIRGHRRVTLLLMEGYAFVASGLPDTKYFELENQPYVAQIMSCKGGRYQMRTVATIPDKTVSDLKLRLRKMVTVEMPLGARVLVQDGPYRNLEGVVCGSEGDNALVEIRLRSLAVITEIPRVLLERLEETSTTDVSEG